MKYIYKKQVNGRGRFGGAELELIKVYGKSKVIDKCEWKDWKKNNVDFQETPFMKSVKGYILNSIDYTIRNYTSLHNFEISLIDIQILPVDTLPSHILASAIIGFFELLDESLNESEIKKIDYFITENEKIDFPDYQKLIGEFLDNNRQVKTGYN
ncbi:hypothetical protein [Tenacibaculum ovolyticum]|uniref:hypothetical protein n=2 Tax=Tenacibaculum ovolyticum TaxID=104270 RepID=UPI0007ECA5DB|nr:hypothetical protein [Tenacibaculum ovolyticum]